MTTALKIDFVSDVSCPWCVIGLRALDQALARRAILLPSLPPGLPLNLVSPRTGGVAVLQQGLRFGQDRTAYEREELSRRDAAQIRKSRTAREAKSFHS
jgi:hypothetical protein